MTSGVGDWDRLAVRAPRLIGALVLGVPLAAWANTIVPANDFGVPANVMLFPLVVGVEYLVYRLHKSTRPLVSSLVLNGVTSVLGLFLWVLAPGIAGLAGLIAPAGLRPVFHMLAFPLVHFAFTALVEHGVNVLALNRAQPIPFGVVFRANAATYIPIAALNAVIAHVPR